MTSRKKLTVADLIALKGKRKLVLVTAFDEWTARAAEMAGIDMLVAWGTNLEHSKYIVQAVRRGAPNTLIGSGINPDAYVSESEAIRTANEIRAAGADIIYCSGLIPEKWAALRKQVAMLYVSCSLAFHVITVVVCSTSLAAAMWVTYHATTLGSGVRVL